MSKQSIDAMIALSGGKAVVIPSAALIMRENEGADTDGCVVFGVSHFRPDFIQTEEDHLVLGTLVLIPNHIFRGFKGAEGDDPNDMLLSGGLDWRSYREVILGGPINTLKGGQDE